MPHLVLDSHADGRLEVGASRVLDRRQEVPLSGGFARLYSLHAPDGYGAEALQVFSPDVVAALVEEPLEFDLELVGQWALLYSAHRLELADPTTWQRVARFEEHVLSRLVRSTGRYVDRRAAPAPSAPTPGGGRGIPRRAQEPELRSQVSTPATVLGVVAVGGFGCIAVLLVAMLWIMQ